MVEVRVTEGVAVDKHCVEVLASMVAATQTIAQEEGFPGEFVMFMRLPPGAIGDGDSDCVMIGTMEPGEAAEYVGAWLVSYAKRLTQSEDAEGNS